MAQANFKTVLVLAAGMSISGLSLAQVAIPRQPGMTRPAGQTSANVPAEFKTGIADLFSAKSSLEKAGDRWGGHRVKAIHMIDEALRATGQPVTSNRNEMKSGPQDEPAALESGVSSLNSAKSAFEQSGNQWGGRREKAVSFINGALQELQVGIEYAKAHHTY